MCLAVAGLGLPCNPVYCTLRLRIRTLVRLASQAKRACKIPALLPLELNRQTLNQRPPRGSREQTAGSPGRRQTAAAASRPSRNAAPARRRDRAPADQHAPLAGLHMFRALPIRGLRRAAVEARRRLGSGAGLPAPLPKREAGRAVSGCAGPVRATLPPPPPPSPLPHPPHITMQLARAQTGRLAARQARPAAVSRARCTRAMAYKVTLKTPSGERQGRQGGRGARERPPRAAI